MPTKTTDFRYGQLPVKTVYLQQVNQCAPPRHPARLPQRRRPCTTSTPLRAPPQNTGDAWRVTTLGCLHLRLINSSCSNVEMQRRLTRIAVLLWQNFGVSREPVNLRCKHGWLSHVTARPKGLRRRQFELSPRASSSAHSVAAGPVKVDHRVDVPRRVERPGGLASATPTASCVSLSKSCGLMRIPPGGWACVATMTPSFCNSWSATTKAVSRWPATPRNTAPPQSSGKQRSAWSTSKPRTSSTWPSSSNSASLHHSRTHEPSDQSDEATILPVSQPTCHRDDLACGAGLSMSCGESADYRWTVVGGDTWRSTQ